MQPQQVRDILAKNMRARRKELGKTQVDIAGAVGVSQSFISLLEKAETSISTDMLGPLADALQTTPDALLTAGVFSRAVA